MTKAQEKRMMAIDDDYGVEDVYLLYSGEVACVLHDTRLVTINKDGYAVFIDSVYKKYL